MKVGNSIKIICPQSYSIEILMGKPKEDLNEIFQTIINKIVKKMLMWGKNNLKHQGHQMIRNPQSFSSQLQQADQNQLLPKRLISIR